ncbi:MAG: hypothetical protein EOP84_28135 [Verrucomicrobiaceae bacterium]|nr:MAG: hypothetical protein EOP84_28135 [Verrucomicrobiaceae bacterium]
MFRQFLLLLLTTLTLHTAFAQTGKITGKVLNAKNFGVPQNRERLFIVGSLHNENFEFPQPKLTDNFVTVEDAFADFAEAEVPIDLTAGGACDLAGDDLEFSEIRGRAIARIGAALHAAAVWSCCGSGLCFGL